MSARQAPGPGRKTSIKLASSAYLVNVHSYQYRSFLHEGARHG